MAELIPQITYSPEGVLTVTTQFIDDEPVIVEARRQGFEALAGYKGVVLSGDEQRGQATVNILEALGSNFTNRGDAKILKFLMLLKRALPSHPEDQIDRVAGLETISDRGAWASIYPQFQSWLNGQGIPEDAALETILAMAVPFGPDEVAKARPDFTAYTEARGGVGRFYGVAANTDTFGFYRQEDKGNSVIERSGKARWRWPNFRTLGDCACWGAIATSRESIRLGPEETLRLYELSPHNVDFARQTLSHILGLGTLAYHAARYEVPEDLFDSIEWEEPQEVKKTALQLALEQKQNL